MAETKPGDYSWEECMDEQMERYDDEDTASRVCGMIRDKYSKTMTADRAAWLASIYPAIEKALGVKPKEQSVTADKHHLSPRFARGVDRDQLKAEDYVFGDAQLFPIMSPLDVHDAIHAWGRYKGAHTHEEFKRALVALAKRKGNAYMAALPKSWLREAEREAEEQAEASEAKAVRWDDLALQRRAQLAGEAFMEQFRFGPTGTPTEGQTPTPQYAIETIYGNYLTVRGWDGHLYKVSYKVDEQTGDIQFAETPAWREVEMLPEAVKAAGDWEVDILALPFGGPYNGRDAQGQFFAADTDVAEKQFPNPPLVYYHGLDDDGHPTGDPVFIGQTVKRWIDERGIWFRGVLDKTIEKARLVWDAVQRHVAAASSGTAEHLKRVDNDGHIRLWPVVEVSLFEMLNGKLPANPYAVVLPAMKAVYERAGLAYPLDIEAPEATPEAATTVAAAGVEGAVVVTVQPTGDTNMETSELKAALAEAIGPLQAKVDGLQADLTAIKAQPPAQTAAGVVVTHDPADNPFTSLAEQCKAIRTVAKGGRIDSRLLRLRDLYGDGGDEALDALKATGANESVPSQGGFLLEPTLVAEFLKPLHQEGPFSKMVRRMPVSSNSNYGWINGIDETSRADGSRWGGIRGYRLGEGGAKTASKPKFRRINWELKKYAVLVYATDELLEDAAQFSAVVTQGASEELSFMANDDILNGAGAAGPLGILQSGALISQAIEAGQLADTVVHENLEKMWARLLPRSRASNATIWSINAEVEPFLNMLLIAGGTGVLEARFVQYDQQGILRIKGKPVIVTEFNSAIGDVGDIVLADLNEYLFWEKGGVQSAQSIHVNFLYDETIFRFVYRCDGQTALASALTPYKGTATQSPFVTLAAR